MKSIKRQLMLSILALMCLGTLVMVIITYFELKEEMDELFDENMVQIAEAIAVHDFSVDNTLFQTGQNTRQRLKGEEEFLIQIWNDQTLSYSSLPALEVPYQGAGGVKTIIFDNQEWRYYGLAQGNWLIQISQPIPERHSVIREFYSEILIPMLVQLPILVGLILFFVSHGFKPLRQISASIQKRSSTFLDRLPEGDVPEEISALVAALNDLLGRLDSAIKTQRRFTADAAHELRTPLTAISLQLDILRRSKTEEEKEEVIQELYRGVDRSTHLVRQLLELARQEPDAGQILSGTCNLKDIVTDALEQHQTLAKDKNIEVQFEANEKCKIEGDENALGTMVSNLLNNAILYTEAGGKVHVSLSKTPDGIALRIADNGPGIAEEERQRIFDRFYRIVGTSATGSGLGLSIVKTIAQRHGASVTVDEGLDNGGTAFNIVFPK